MGIDDGRESPSMRAGRPREGRAEEPREQWQHDGRRLTLNERNIVRMDHHRHDKPFKWRERAAETENKKDKKDKKNKKNKKNKRVLKAFQMAMGHTHQNKNREIKTRRDKEKEKEK